MSDIIGQFENTRILVAAKRYEKNISQGKLGKLLGFKNGQTISNLERGLQGFPLDRLNDLAMILSIDKTELLEAVMKDYELRIKSKLGM